MRTRTLHQVFTLGVLLGINTMNFFDRQILPAVQEKIRNDWHLSDSELGWLGTSFILLYAVVGLPLGRLADIWQRKWILALGVGLWSLLTIGSGWAWGFWSLFVMRLGVGVGEASCAPAASSLIGDLVPAEQRARAMAVFMLGLPVGLALSFLVSSAIAQRYGWQPAFYVAGLPGLLLAVAALFIVEPSRGGSGGAATSARLPFGTVLRRVLALPTMWWLIASGALHNFNMYGLGTFGASFLKRYHRISVAEAGQVSSLVYGFGALGIFAAGWLGDRAFRRGVSGRLHVAWIGLAVSMPCLLMALEAPAGAIGRCAVWLVLTQMLLYAYYGTVYATIQDIVEPALRGTAMAIYFCAMYFLGALFGPVAMGWLSDALAERAAQADLPVVGASTVGTLGAPLGQGPWLSASVLGPERIEWHKATGLHDAMYLIPILNAVLVVVLLAASRTVSGDYQRRKDKG
jgi:MFS family permease